MKRFDNINVIPLIDVMLVLLAIVLTTASFIVNDHLKIELPETEHTQTYSPQTDRETTSLAIDQHNHYFADDEMHSFENLQTLLENLPKNQAITLKVDKDANFGSFVELVDLLKGLELTNLSILTEAQTQ